VKDNVHLRQLGAMEALASGSQQESCQPFIVASLGHAGWKYLSWCSMAPARGALLTSTSHHQRNRRV
jgi:hypothetical protein